MNPASIRRKRWRRGSITGGVLIVIALSIYFIPSIFLRQYVTDYLAEQGLEAEGIDQVHINPYGPSLETDSLTLTNTEGTVFHLDALELFLEFTPLMQRRIDIGGANLVGLELFVRQLDAGSIALRGLPVNEGAYSDSDAQTLGGWSFGVTHLELEDAIVHIDLDRLQGNLTIDELIIENVKVWLPNQVSNLTAEGTFGNSPYSLELELLPFAEKPNGTLKLSADDLPAENIDIGSPLKGLVSANFDVTFDSDSQFENITATLNGSVS
ncbi:MAG: hypothetical protein HUJ31_16415, partial [Pseudomonadales bacterium]|nr:hypothetical protein [Pseudomonadales bacterium]